VVVDILRQGRFEHEVYTAAAYSRELGMGVSTARADLGDSIRGIDREHLAHHQSAQIIPVGHAPERRVASTHQERQILGVDVLCQQLRIAGTRLLMRTEVGCKVGATAELHGRDAEGETERRRKTYLEQVIVIALSFRRFIRFRYYFCVLKV